MILFLEVCAFPPIRQKKGEWMGHGAGTALRSWYSIFVE
jgi:hypothetical protein